MRLKVLHDSDRKAFKESIGFIDSPNCSVYQEWLNAGAVEVTVAGKIGSSGTKVHSFLALIYGDTIVWVMNPICGSQKHYSGFYMVDTTVNHINCQKCRGGR